VVVGILLAFTLNNWNEQRKDRQLEIRILREISSNLILDLSEIRSDIGFMDTVNYACQNVINFINAETKPSSRFYYDAGRLRITPRFNPNRSGYLLLTSKGIDLIVNDSLRKTISILYESSYPYYNSYQEERLQFSLIHIDPKMLEYFSWIHSSKPGFGEYLISQEDYIKIKNDALFLKFVRAIAFENYLVQRRARRIEMNIAEAIDILKAELERNQN